MKSKNSSLFIIITYLAYGLCADFFLNSIIDKVRGESFTGFRIFTIIEHALLSKYIYVHLKSIRLKKICKILSFLFFLTSAVDFFLPHQDTFDSIPAGLSALLIILFSTFYLFDQLQNPKSIIYYNASFWMISSFILYFSGTFFIFIFYNYYKSAEYVSFYTIINSFFSLLRNILILVGVSTTVQKKKNVFFQ